MSASLRVAKDKEMASRLKREGVERKTGVCPTCYRLIPNGTFFPAAVDSHILSCPGPARRKGC